MFPSSSFAVLPLLRSSRPPLFFSRMHTRMCCSIPLQREGCSIILAPLSTTKKECAWPCGGICRPRRHQRRYEMRRMGKRLASNGYRLSYL